MFKDYSENVSRIVAGVSCLAAAVWLAMKTCQWIERNWYSSDGSMMIPIMSALMAVSLMATGFAAMIRADGQNEEAVVEPEDLNPLPVYEE